MAHSEHEPHHTELPDLTEDLVTVDVDHGVLTIRGETTGTILRVDEGMSTFLAHMVLSAWAHSPCDCDDHEGMVDDDE